MHFAIVRLNFHGNIPHSLNFFARPKLEPGSPNAAAALAKSRLPRDDFRTNVNRMSTVEIALRKVRKLSARQAKELLGWLAERHHRTRSPSPTARRTPSTRLSTKQLNAWHDSVRGTTDWEPPRMPADLVKPFRF